MAQIIGAVWPLLLTAQGLPTGATRPPRTNPQVTLADSKRVRFRQLMPRPWGWWSFLQCHAWSPASPVPAGPGDLRAKEGWEQFAPPSTRTARKVLGDPSAPKNCQEDRSTGHCHSGQEQPGGLPREAEGQVLLCASWTADNLL